ncbi:MAG: transcriptional repressor NrdR [Clostridia bacterium]|nr:transcriptional repressor NrdR [Clostridia bacterium]MBQ4542751.1 transcriptional repressor NrdR [Clostridia bacterium]MBQ7075244.1 transcriptional repressor NrdR [Clostridia bacterium]
MRCVFCGNDDSKVIDSRANEDNTIIKRRRECLNCGKRFTTYERIESPIVVVKKDGTRQHFDKDKLLNGLVRACEKRPVSLFQLEEIVDSVEVETYKLGKREIATSEIGEIVMSKLKEVDDVAYVRFASVYRQFKDVGTFMDELKKIIKEK